MGTKKSAWLRIIISLLILVMVWQIATFFGLINKNIVSSPTEVILAFLDSPTQTIENVFVSLERITVGFTIASVFGIGGALALYLNKKLSELALPLIEIIRPISPVAWIPIAIMWFGVGDKPAFFLVSLGAFFPIFTNSFDALESVNKNYLHAAKNLGASKLKTITRVLFPAALPQIITGMKIGLGVGWMTLITAELVGSTSGLGYMIQMNRMLLQTENVILGMVIIGILGFLMTKFMGLFENRMIRWRNYAYG